MLNGGWISMPDWQDSGFVLATRRFSENGVILSVLTPSHGRHLGLIRTKTLPLIGSFVKNLIIESTVEAKPDIALLFE